MDLSIDALELVCKHLDVRSIVQLAGTDSATRSKLAKCTIHVQEPLLFVPTPTRILQQFFFHRQFMPTWFHVYCVAWCPVGTTFAFGMSNSCVYIFDPARSLEPIVLCDNDWTVERMAYSPDGSELVTVSPGGTMRIRDSQTGQTKRVIRFDAHILQSVSWDTNRIRLVTGSMPQMHTWNADGSNVVHGREIRTLLSDWSPDDTKLVSATYYNKSVYILDAETGEELREMSGHTDFVKCFAWSPDSTKVVSGSHDNTARVWDAATGQ